MVPILSGCPNHKGFHYLKMGVYLLTFPKKFYIEKDLENSLRMVVVRPLLKDRGRTITLSTPIAIGRKAVVDYIGNKGVAELVILGYSEIELRAMKEVLDNEY